MAAVGRGVDDGVADHNERGGNSPGSLGDEKRPPPAQSVASIGPPAVQWTPPSVLRTGNIGGSPSFSFHTPQLYVDCRAQCHPPRLGGGKTVPRAALTKEELVSPCRMTSVAG